MILILALTINPSCIAQNEDSLFLGQFYKEYSNTDKSKNEAIIYFEAIKVVDRYILSLIKGLHPQFIYNRTYETLSKIEADEFRRDTIKYIHFNIAPDESGLYMEANAITERVAKFKEKYKIPEEVKVIINANSLPRH